MSIHPYNTMSFVHANGYSLSPGFETYIGLRMVRYRKETHPHMYTHIHIATIDFIQNRLNNMTEGKAFDLSADLGRSHPPRALKQNVSI